MTANQPDKATELEAMYTDMAAHSLEGLWRMERHGPDVRPYLWQWDTVHRIVSQSAGLIDIAYPGERRAVALVNPGIPGALGSTHAIYTAVQLVKPGEVARAHRHTPSALRFMIEGEGTSTTVEGERVPMYPGDLVLTPSWLWHEHRNDSDADAVWLDGLDSPLVFGLAAAVYEPYENGFLEETRPEDHTGRVVGLGALRPIGYEEAPGKGSPLLVYRWTAVEPAMQRMAEDGVDTPFDGVSIEYANSGSGGHTLSTMSCWMTMLRPGEQTKAHRHTHSSVYYAHRGSGATIIDGQRFAWGERDMLVVPPWAWHEHVNETDSVAYLFSINDVPTLEAFDLNREEAYAENDGHQQVASTFDPGNLGL